jgi:hypothetical protein
MIYKVRIGEDVYVGTPEEVVAFMMRAQGAPGTDPASYMEAMAARVAEHFDVAGIDTSEEIAFLDSLAENGVLSIEVSAEPSRQRVPREDALGEGPVAFGPGVEPDDIDL